MFIFKHLPIIFSPLHCQPSNNNNNETPVVSMYCIAFVAKREETSINLIKSNIIIVYVLLMLTRKQIIWYGCIQHRRTRLYREKMMIKNKISLNYPLTILLLLLNFFLLRYSLLAHFTEEMRSCKCFDVRYVVRLAEITRIHWNNGQFEITVICN